MDGWTILSWPTSRASSGEFSYMTTILLYDDDSRIWRWYCNRAFSQEVSCGRGWYHHLIVWRLCLMHYGTTTYRKYPCCVTGQHIVSTRCLVGCSFSILQLQWLVLKYYRSVALFLWMLELAPHRYHHHSSYLGRFLVLRGWIDNSFCYPRELMKDTRTSIAIWLCSFFPVFLKAVRSINC